MIRLHSRQDVCVHLPPFSQWEVIVKVGSANAYTNIPLQSMGERPVSGSELSDVSSDVEGMPLRSDD